MIQFKMFDDRLLIHLLVIHMFISFWFVHIGTSTVCPDQRVKCSTEQTCCQNTAESFGCCPSSLAVCCSDGLHCCPQGTYCDIVQEKCLISPKLLEPNTSISNNMSSTNSSNKLECGLIDDDIPDWFYGVQYCVIWQDPYPTKKFVRKDCVEILQQTIDFDVCDGTYTDHDCYRNISFEISGGSGAPAWWASVQMLSNSPVWSTRFTFKAPTFAPAWLLNLKMCFYRNGVPFCAPTNQWTPEIDYVNHIHGAFGFLAS